MATEPKSLKLKRKREGEGAQRKKSKKARKSGAGPQEHAHDVIAQEDKPKDTLKNEVTVDKDELVGRLEPSDSAQRDEKPRDASTVNADREPATSRSDPIRTKDEEESVKKSKERRMRVSELKRAGAEQPGHNESHIMKGQDEVHNATGKLGMEKKHKRVKSKSKPKSHWTVSSPTGGWFLFQDPVFSLDEKHILLANKTHVQAYAVETSLVVNSLPISSGSISSFALSAVKPDRCYLANEEGIISLWDWVNGTLIARWDVGANVRQIVVSAQAEKEEDLVYCHEVEKRHSVSVHALRTKEQASPTESKRILKTTSAIVGIQVLLKGRIVIVACNDSVFIGSRSNSHKAELQDIEYVWREFQVSSHISTFDAYLRLSSESYKGRDPLFEQQPNVDLAVGDDQGVVHVYDDIITSLVRAEKVQDQDGGNATRPEGLSPRRLHWHRDAVGCVKWSKDGRHIPNL
jgi:NET1-associated nuclear protein 1 (U3 small nucleolar RNA-associated protein 17)